MDHHRAGADAAPRSDRHRAEHRRAGRDHDVVLDRRVALALVEARAAERDALVERDVVADVGGLADHDAHAVVDEEAAADVGAGVDVDAGEEAADVGDEARDSFRSRRQSQCETR